MKPFNHPQPKPIDVTDAINHIGRFYTSQGRSLPSVTTVLKHTHDSSYLKHWNARNPGKLEAAGIRGGKFHDLIEAYIKFGTEDRLNTSYIYFKQIKPLLDNLDVCFLELPVFSTAIGVAGRIDCAAIFNGYPVLIDWKSKEKDSPGLYDYPLQLAAYAKLFTDCYPDYPLKFNYGMIAVATPKKLTLHTLTPEDMDRNFEQYRERVNRFYTTHMVA